MLHILHAADLHLDAPFASLPAPLARQRRQEQRLLLDKLADAAIEGRADLVLLAGDLLDHRQTYRETAQALADTLGRIPAPVAIAPGNHDCYTPASLYAAPIWPKNVVIFRESALQKVALPNCDLYGAAFTSPHRPDSPLHGFTAPRTGKPAIMVLHGDVDGTGDYAPIPRSDIAKSGLNYLALGHIHAPSGLQREGGTYWAYPGCAEGRGFDETGDRGAYWVTLRDDGKVEAQLLPLAARRYEDLTVDLTGADPLQALQAALAAGSQADICRVTLTGEAHDLDLRALMAAAAPLRFSLTLRDHTRSPQSLWQRAGEDSLTGLFLRQLREQMEGAESEERRALLEKAAKFGLAALEHGEDTP